MYEDNVICYFIFDISLWRIQAHLNDNKSIFKKYFVRSRDKDEGGRLTAY